MATFHKGRQLSRSELKEGMHVILHRLDKEISEDNEAEAKVTDDLNIFSRRTESGEWKEFVAQGWDGDTIVHGQGKRFKVYAAK